MREKKQGVREQERQRRIQKLREKNFETKKRDRPKETVRYIERQKDKQRERKRVRYR